MAREPSFDLGAALARKGFTPGQKDVAGLVELATTEDVGGRAGPALVALGAREAVSAAFAARTEDGERAKLTSVIGLFARGGDAIARDALVGLLGASGRVRRAAIVALGKVSDEVAREALVACWDAGGLAIDEQRALAEALGKVGGEAAMARLGTLDASGDQELGRRRDRAVLMADRTSKRAEDSTIAVDVAPPMPVTLRLVTRGGLAGMLADELGALRVRATSPTDSAAQIEWSRPLAELFAARLWVSLAVRLPLPGPVDAPLVERVVALMTAPSTRALLRAWTRGTIRWRLGFADGHKRAVVWNVAKAVTAAAPELLNDPTATTWDVLVDEEARVVELVPKKLEDPRFAWRVAEVPAASHPTVAAALARVAEARGSDRVWDPFCGSGAELVERARLGPAQMLIGTDIDEGALAAARENTAAAGVVAELSSGDARADGPREVDLILTNPPLGSRVQVDAAALLVEALPNLVKRLAPRGRLVWITPAFRRTGPVLERLGLRRTKAWPVDLGGVRGTLERWEWPLRQ